MALAREVLQNQPNVWEYACYEENIYHTFELSRNDPEWNAIVSPLYENGLHVKSLHRVQNPFQLGIFTYKKEQKEHRQERADILKYYHPLHNSDLHKALKYNMDVRRYAHYYSGNREGKKIPKFFKKPTAAYNAIPECSNKVILVCDMLGSRFNEPKITSKDNDSEHMPTYVVALNN